MAIHLLLEVFHHDFLDRADAFGVSNRLIAFIQGSVDVHTVNPITLTHLNTGTDIAQSVIVVFQIEVAIGSEVNHDFIILSFFNLLQGIAQIELRQWAQDRTGGVQGQPLQHSQHTFEDVEQTHTARVHHPSLF